MRKRASRQPAGSRGLLVLICGPEGDADLPSPPGRDRVDLMDEAELQ